MEAPIPEPLISKIKQNGDDIRKFHILDENGNPVVKANLTYENIGYEVTYDLDNAEVLGDNSFTISFQIRRDGSETVFEDTLNWKPGKGSAGLLLSMDDDYIEVWENYFSLFSEYGARITFFVNGTYTPFTELAISLGHDVGYHGLNHKDLRGMSFDKLSEEAIEPLETYGRHGIVLLSFAFPYGFSDEPVREKLLETFNILRGYGTTYRTYNRDEISSGYIISKAIDNVVIKDEDNFYRLITLMLRTVKFLGDDFILPLTTHDISDTEPWAISQKRLEFLLQTTADLNLIFYCYSDFIY